MIAPTARAEPNKERKRKRKNSLPEQHEGSCTRNPPPVVLLVPKTGSGVVTNRQRALRGRVDFDLVLDLEVSGNELVGLGKGEAREFGGGLAL
jgi:hypothetical protein